MISSQNQFTITVLVENTVNQRNLIAEHGLSFWIESDQGEIVFDTGQGMALPRNAEQMHIPLERAKAIVLSHGHYDHTGGLGYVLDKNKEASIFFHPDALKTRYHKPKDSIAKEIGMSKPLKEKLKTIENRIQYSTIPVSVMDGVNITGSIPRKTFYEDTGGSFFLDPEGTQPDLILDDQALWIETQKGLVVLLGCAHSGVVNTLDYIANITGKKNFYAVLGGMHLNQASSERLNSTSEAFYHYDVQIVAPSHCTGFSATYFLQKYLSNSFKLCATSSKFSF